MPPRWCSTCLSTPLDESCVDLVRDRKGVIVGLPSRRSKRWLAPTIPHGSPSRKRPDCPLLPRDRRLRAALRGNGEARATGIVAALVAERLCASPCEPGVFHIEQLFEPVEIFDRVEDRGLTAGLQDRRFK